MIRWVDVGQEAHGVIAIGQLATGVIALGQAATGVIAIGQVARGIVAVGQLSLGIVTIGQLTLGVAWSAGMLGMSAIKGPGIVLPLVLVPDPGTSDAPPAPWTSRIRWWGLPLWLALAVAVAWFVTVPLVDALLGVDGILRPAPR